MLFASLEIIVDVRIRDPLLTGSSDSSFRNMSVYRRFTLSRVCRTFIHSATTFDFVTLDLDA